LNDISINETRFNMTISEGKLEMESAIALRSEIRKGTPDLSVAELNQLVSQTSLLPAFSAVDHILTAMKTKQFENIVVTR